MSYDSREETLKHIRAVRTNLLEVELNLSMRGMEHDLSKLEDPEKSAFDAIGPDKPPYNTPEYEQMKELLGPALDHHYSVNDHHPEHHKNAAGVGVGVRAMSCMAILEMLADWKAAAEREGKTLAESLDINVKRFWISVDLEHVIKNTAGELGWI